MTVFLFQREFVAALHPMDLPFVHFTDFKNENLSEISPGWWEGVGMERPVPMMYVGWTSYWFVEDKDHPNYISSVIGFWICELYRLDGQPEISCQSAYAHIL